MQHSYILKTCVAFRTDWMVIIRGSKMSGEFSLGSVLGPTFLAQVSVSVLVHMVLERLGISEDIVLTNRAAVDLVYMVFQCCSRAPFELTYATAYTRMLCRHMRPQTIFTFEALFAIVTRKFALLSRQWGFGMNGLRTCGTNGDDSRTKVTMEPKRNLAGE